MLIGAAVNGADLQSLVTERYEDATHLFIVETDDDSIAAVHERQDLSGIFFAEKLYEHDCEAVVCGIMQMPGFEKVAGYSITRFFGSGLPVLDAIHGALNNSLPNIVDYEGGTGCDSHDHECDGSCGANNDGEECDGDCANCSERCR